MEYIHVLVIHKPEHEYDGTGLSVQDQKDDFILIFSKNDMANFDTEILEKALNERPNALFRGKPFAIKIEGVIQIIPSDPKRDTVEAINAIETRFKEIEEGLKLE